MLRWILIVGLLFLAVAPVGWAADRRAVKALAEFEIAPDGDFVLLPLVINQREYRFLLSTGLATTVIDQKLREQLVLQAIETRNNQGGRRKKRYSLHARLGNTSLTFPDGVETADYTAMREGLDLDFHGEIGMDVLRGQIMQIDFDDGILRFLPNVPAGSGEAIKINQAGQENGVPMLQLIVSGEKPQKFFISTARAGNAIDIDNRFLAELEEKDKLTVLANEKGVARSGTSSFKTVRLESIQIGSFRHERIVANSGEGNSVGLQYLSRYLVTFDFPKGKMYLKKGAHFDALDAPLSLWEVAVERDEKSVKVTNVHPHGPASRLGLRAGDRLETLNDRPALRMSNWQIRRVLGSSSLPLTAEVIRGGTPLKLATEPPDAETTGADVAPKGD